jgi:hypothetical protein
MYLIWSFEHHAWWRPERQGYTDNMADAGRYTAREAGEIVTASIWNDEVAVPVTRASCDGPPKFHPYAGNDPNYFGG